VEWLAAGLVYIAVHVLVYLVCLRDRQWFSGEGAILVYHLAPFIIVTVALLLRFALSPPVPWAPPVATLLLLALYSFSFLELWALSDGGYSLRILDRIDIVGRAGTTLDLDDLVRLGESKKRTRIGSLQRLRLVRRDGQVLGLTPLGRAIAAGLSFIAWVVDIRKIG
jgi:hypothetical protein